MVVLLLGLGLMVNPGLFLVDKSSAVTIQDEWVVTEPDNTNTSDADGSGNDEVDDSFGGFGGDDYNVSSADTEAGIAPMSVVPAPTLAITVGNTGQEINAAQGGNTVYGSYNVSLTGSNVKDYTLSIKADSTNLTMPSGASSSTSTVSGAGGKAGNSMTANTWGYKLTETSTSESSYGTLNYASLPTSLQQIANGTVSSPYNLSVGKKLVFAAKFGDNATPGKYSGSIALSLSATPAQTGQLWSNGTPSYITDMQDIKSGFCASSLPTEATITLKDSRDNNSYKIVKLKDGKCWMQENLRLGGSSAITLTPNNTNIESNYTLPASKDSTWTSSERDGDGQMRVGKDDMTISTADPGNGAGWQSNYGNYYSWCAATAGTCNEATSTSKNVNVSGSICPKNWHLPSGGSSDSTGTDVGQNSEFYKLFGTDGANLGSSWQARFDTIKASPYIFPAAGFIYYSSYTGASLYGAGSSSYYWSRTSDSGSSGYSYLAYALFFSSSSFSPGTVGCSRHGGQSVRCVADY